MKHKIQTAFIFFIFIANINITFSQLKLTEKELIGNWIVTGGSGPDFDKEIIGWAFTFNKEYKISRFEEGEKIVSDWKFENNVITITHDYNDGKNDPEIETLTIIAFDGKKLTVKYDYYDEDDNFNLIMERAKMP